MHAIVRLATSENAILGLLLAALAALIGVQVSSLEPHLGPADGIGHVEGHDSDPWEVQRKRSLELMEYNGDLFAKLQQGEVGLAVATEDYVRANRDRYGYLRALRSVYPASSLEESAALSLIYMVENVRWRQTGLPTEAEELRQQYAEWFGHPPQHHCVRSSRETSPLQEQPASSCER